MNRTFTPAPLHPGAPLIFPGRTFQNHDRQVVDGAGAAYEFREPLIDAVADARGGAAAVLLNDFDQARLAELFALFVQALGDAVGIDDHDVARLDFDPAFAVIAERGDADREAADVEPRHLSRSPRQERRIVSAVDVGQLVGARVEFAVKQRDVAVGGRVVVNVLVDLADDLAGRQPRTRVRAHRRVDR